MDIKYLTKKLKLIVFDLDGTLLNDRGQVGSETKRLVELLQSEGLSFSFATGRLHSAVVDYAEQLNLNAPIISLDGCLIKNHSDKKIIFESAVPVKYVVKALSLAGELNLTVALCHDEAIYYTSKNSGIPESTDKLGANFEQVKSYDEYLNKTLEILISGRNYRIMKYFFNKMSFPYSFGLTKAFYKSYNYHNLYFIEIRKKGSSKGEGLKRLASYLKIKMNEAAVLGDWYNDISMFRLDSLKVAMANAVDQIRDSADIILNRTNNEDGTAEFLELVFKNRKS